MISMKRALGYKDLSDIPNHQLAIVPGENAEVFPAGLQLSQL